MDIDAWGCGGGGGVVVVGKVKVEEGDEENAKKHVAQATLEAGQLVPGLEKRKKNIQSRYKVGLGNKGKKEKKKIFKGVLRHS